MPHTRAYLRTSDDEDSEDCDDSVPECEEYDVPAAGDNCDKHVALHVLALSQLSQLRRLGLELIEVSVALTVQSELLPHDCPLLSCYLPSPFLLSCPRGSNSSLVVSRCA